MLMPHGLPRGRPDNVHKLAVTMAGSEQDGRKDAHDPGSLYAVGVLKPLTPVHEVSEPEYTKVCLTVEALPTTNPTRVSSTCSASTGSCFTLYTCEFLFLARDTCHGAVTKEQYSAFNTLFEYVEALHRTLKELIVSIRH